MKSAECSSQPDLNAPTEFMITTLLNYKFTVPLFRMKHADIFPHMDMKSGKKKKITNGFAEELH